MKIPVNFSRRRPKPETREQIIEDVIGAQLRSYYTTLENQQIPAQFLKLLKKLETRSPPVKE